MTATAFAQLGNETALPVTDFRSMVADGILEAMENDPRASRRQKRQAQRVMNGAGFFAGWRREKILDAAIEQMHADGMIVVTNDGVEAAVDWTQLLTWFQKALPLLIQLFSLFGG